VSKQRVPFPVIDRGRMDRNFAELDRFFAENTIQRGTDDLSFSTSSADSGSITFSQAFKSAPTVLLTVEIGSNFDVLANVQSLTATGFSWRVFQNAGTNITGSGTLHWLAIGPT
jgi:hypothetical protein